METRKTRKSAAKSTTKIPAKLSAKQFIQQFKAAQIELMNGMLECIHNGEIQITDDGADDVIEDITGNWSSKDEPEFESHMETIAAIFLWALLDQVYGEALE